MTNPIFRKLQDAIEHPCRSVDWFGMAEQAINTIYALGEHPDVLCNNLIKNLTRRAFAKRPSSTVEKPNDENAMDEDVAEPSHAGSSTLISSQSRNQSQGSAVGGSDMGDAFELAQMVFVVGHVAIKHIVYLELVERGWKRQKHEREAGTLQFIRYISSTKLMTCF